MSNENPAARSEQLIRRLFERQTAMDPKGMKECFAPDALCEIPFNPSGAVDDASVVRRKGPELLAWIDYVMPHLETFRMEDMEFTTSADGKVCFLECRTDCMGTGGVPYKNRYVFRFDIDVGGNKIKRYREYLNVIAAVGLFENFATVQFKDGKWQ